MGGSYKLSEEQEMIRTMARDMAKDRLAPRAAPGISLSSTAKTNC